MKIHSRPFEQSVGEGAYTLKVDYDEVMLIATFLNYTRLGQTAYQQAAYKLMTSIEEYFGEEFSGEAAEAVNLYVSRLDDDGVTIIEQYHASEIEFDV